MTKEEMLLYFDALNQELSKRAVVGELYLTGGAVMCLVLHARPTTKDIDALFEPKTKLYEAASSVAKEFALNKDWLNDAVKGFLSAKGKFDEYEEKSNLKIFTAAPEYVLAMKCLSMRLGESEDFSDVEFLIAHLQIKSRSDVLHLVSKYYPEEQIPQRTYYALEEIFEKISLNQGGKKDVLTPDR